MAEPCAVTAAGVFAVAAPHPVFLARKSRWLSSRRRAQPRNASFNFCRNVGMHVDDTLDCMSLRRVDERLEESLDIDRRSSLEIVRIIQEQDRSVAEAVAAEAERIAHAIDQIVE